MNIINNLKIAAIEFVINMRPLLKLLLLYCIISDTVKMETTDNPLEFYRSKRQINALPLVFPYAGTFKFIIGLSSPIPMKDKINLQFAANFQYQYLLFTNITQLSQYYFIKEVSREQRELDVVHRKDERLVFYRAFANLLDAKGLNGQECILRAICEAAQYPVGEEGLIGEILHILLTPDYGRTPFDDEDSDWEASMAQFKDAATAGRQMFNCPSIYSGCPEGQGVLELATVLRDE